MSAQFTIAILLPLLAVVAATISCQPSPRTHEGVDAKDDYGDAAVDSDVDKYGSVKWR